MIANSLRLISVLLVDNYPPIRAGIRNMLSRASDIYVAGESQNGDEARKLLDDLRPSIILLDLVMPGFSPSAFERWIRTHYPETVTLVLTAHDRDTYLSSMADAGVAGFLSKTESINSLITAIRRAASGEVFFSDQQLKRLKEWKGTTGKKWDSLTNREKVVLKLLAKVLSNKKIASDLGVAVKTIEYHIGKMLKKLELKSRQEAIVWLKEDYLNET